MSAGARRPLVRPYARIERERRFLLERLPEAVDPDDFVRLRDCFVAGTHLRLRVVERADGSFLIAKLGQKVPDPEAPDDPRRRSMTTIYLPEAEARALTLEGRRSVKRRYQLVEQGRTFCIDLWEEPSAASGTLLAEVECETGPELDRIHPPAWAVAEVTEDPRFSAYALAGRP